jgi:hypothetical protein
MIDWHTYSIASLGYLIQNGPTTEAQKMLQCAEVIERIIASACSILHRSFPRVHFVSNQCASTWRRPSRRDRLPPRGLGELGLKLPRDGCHRGGWGGDTLGLAAFIFQDGVWRFLAPGSAGCSFGRPRWSLWLAAERVGAPPAKTENQPGKVLLSGIFHKGRPRSHLMFHLKPKRPFFRRCEVSVE